MGAEVVLSVTCPLNTMLLGGVGEGLGDAADGGVGAAEGEDDGDVGVPFPPSQAHANIISRTPLALEFIILTTPHRGLIDVFKVNDSLVADPKGISTCATTSVPAATRIEV